jgi:hypothetical protein
MVTAISYAAGRRIPPKSMTIVRVQKRPLRLLSHRAAAVEVLLTGRIAGSGRKDAD